MRTADSHIVLSPFAAPDAPLKKGDPSINNPLDADPSLKNPAAQDSLKKNQAAPEPQDKTLAVPGSLNKRPAAPGSLDNSPAAQDSPANNSPGPDGLDLKQDLSGSGDSSSGKEAEIITKGSQIYTLNTDSQIVIRSKTLSIG